MIELLLTRGFSESTALSVAGTSIATAFVGLALFKLGQALVNKLR